MATKLRHFALAVVVEHQRAMNRPQENAGRSELAPGVSGMQRQLRMPTASVARMGPSLLGENVVEAQEQGNSHSDPGERP